MLAQLSERAEQLGLGTIALFTSALALAIIYLVRRFTANKNLKLPPHIPSSLPFLGHAISFGKSPTEFLIAAHKKYGPVFSFTMVGKTFTYLVGSDAATLLYNSKDAEMNAQDVYGRLTRPVCGRGVAYDAPNEIFMEQKKMMKTGLNIARFRHHVSLIEKETIEYFKRWGDEGKQGKEIRSILDETVTQLYVDLDGGFSHAAWLLPGWLPLPSFRKRDAAHVKIKQMLYDVIQKRRAAAEPEDDLLQTLLESNYKSGRSLTDDEIAGLLIGLLVAGQQTSSTTTAWMSFFLAKNLDYQEAIYEEQQHVYGMDNKTPLNYDGLKDMPILDRCLKESLRLRPPISTMIRMVRTEQNVLGYTIPKGHQVCVSPPANQKLPTVWADFDEWKPDRFLEADSAANKDKFSYVPFGAGHHRCIGERFAYVQIKTIWLTLTRLYKFELVDNYFPEIDFATLIHTPKNPMIYYKKRPQAS